MTAPQYQAAFKTDLGWMAMIGSDAGVQRLTFGHPSRSAAIEAIAPLPDRAQPISASSWGPDLVDRLDRFASGEPVGFSDVPIDLPPGTPFQTRVRQALQQVAYGTTLSYLELAAAAGRPRAARAVGTVMSTNPIPLILPCHRIVGSGGHLGGYSAPQGLNMKRRLLDMEQGSALVLR
ncbi:MAG: methylated-DNA--[protein]-cysteine S-methyltransferase [Planctomycetaceae bacterium]|nr:methylated-DNA--[protein]-cysteine S-methyltransferase [Planctomycetaceae bacterium]